MSVTRRSFLKWSSVIPILPGTDVALMLAIAYEWVQAGSYDQQFLNTYCVGFDDEHLPEGAEPGTSFKAYITGEGYDMVPKTPEWAQAICGVPADTIRSLAAEIASVDKVNFFCGQSVTKIPAGEQTAQAFYTMAFIMDPENNPLATASGKFEIYSGVLAYMINSVGYSQIAPIAMYQPNDEQGAAARTDEYPLLLFTPHSLRRAHSVNDNVVSLREAFPQECFISVVDAQQRGISNGDTVLMTSPYGKCLRPAKVMSGLVPGAVALQDGAWFQIDEETGIDLGGCPNVLQAPRSSGGGCQAWTGTLVQVEKYEGPLKLEADKNRPVVTPVGIA